jgi:hypothetical protein
MKHITAVLTKPDRIDPGDEGKWMDMLRNRTEKFKHGWFCVRQPGYSQLQARITPDEARENERLFFENTRPWSNAEPDLRARFGTKSLSKALGQKLFDVIARRFARSSTLSFSLLTLLLASLKSKMTSIGVSKTSIPLFTLYNTSLRTTRCLRSTPSSANSRFASTLS